jgi:YfiH family protein
VKEKLMDEFFLRPREGLWFGFAPRLSERGVQHAFTARLGGRSDLSPGSLNLSLHVGDKQAFVIDNRRRVCAALGLDFSLLTSARQAHGAASEYVSAALAGRGREQFADALPDVDALFTDVAGVPLMLLFADCTPIIVAVPGRLVAVIHAGWRGTAAAAARVTVDRLCREFSFRADDCLAVIGPSISADCYEVGEAVYEEAVRQPDLRPFFTRTGEKKWLFDLWRANKQQLIQAGLRAENIVVSGICTSRNRAMFFSHRAEDGRTGRFAALVWL